MPKTSCYPTNLTDEQWNLISDLVPKYPGIGRRLKHPRREVVNAILYIVRAGCAWELLPKDFPPYKTVYDYYNKWRKQDLWSKIHDRLRKKVRVQEGRATAPTAAILDSQTVKCAAVRGSRGCDAGKLIVGRKRHVLVDSLGMILAVLVTPASVQDRDGAVEVLSVLAHTFPQIRLIWADSAYAGKLTQWVSGLRQRMRIALEIVRRSDQQRGFQAQRKRWIVERTFGWLTRYRRLRCDYEEHTESSTAMIHIAMISLMLKRLKS